MNGNSNGSSDINKIMMIITMIIAIIIIMTIGVIVNNPSHNSNNNNTNNSDSNDKNNKSNDKKHKDDTKHDKRILSIDHTYEFFKKLILKCTLFFQNFCFLFTMQKHNELKWKSLVTSDGKFYCEIFIEGRGSGKIVPWHETSKVDF